jgi:acetyltransferase-like isoleucine patch superfamily enzyme
MSFIHPTSVVDQPCTIGKGTKIWHFCHVCEGAEIGEDCILGQNVYIGPGVKIGNRCKIQNNVSVYKGVTIEDDVFLGPSCVFTNDKYPRATELCEFRPTKVCKGASIGANATIVCGVMIGENALVGAGAVVTKNVSANATTIGNPAREKLFV